METDIGAGSTPGAGASGDRAFGDMGDLRQSGSGEAVMIEFARNVTRPMVEGDRWHSKFDQAAWRRGGAELGGVERGE
jgi:hypothetical protein